MTKKNAIIIILAILFLIIAGLLFFYFRNANTPTTTDTGTPTTNSNDLFGNTGNNRPSGTQNRQGGNDAPGTEGETPVKITAKLFQLHKNPTAGSVFFTKDGRDILRFVDRASGNVYEYVPESKTGQSVRITNTTIPKIQDTVWSLSGNNLVFRYTDNETDGITSFAGKITSTSTDSGFAEITGSFLSANIREMVANPLGNTVFSLMRKSGGTGSLGITSTFDGGSKKQIFDSPISFWNIAWPKEDLITFTTKPSYKDYGFLFFFNPKTGTFDRILGNVSGLSAVTNDNGALVAYSGSENASFRLDIYDVKNKTSKGLNVKTLADKCAWNMKNNTVLYCGIPQAIPANTYPDSWYQGLATFSDNLWLINGQTGEMREVYKVGTNENAVIDTENLVVSFSGDYLVFVNKNDLSLWLLEIDG